MSNIEDFLTKKEEEEIVEAIRIAENKTSGEIRVHIERTTDKDVYERTLDVFHLLKMDNTKERNGVLIYVAVDDKAFVIFGDEGINNIVGSEFWNSTRDKIASQFKLGKFKRCPAVLNCCPTSGKANSIPKQMPPFLKSIFFEFGT